MKVRWWFLGALAAITGGILVVKHFVDSKKLLHFVESENEKNFGEFPPDIPESEFEGVDFLT
jgi:hypothetical protein